MKRKLFAALVAGMLTALCLPLPAAAAPAWEEKFATGSHTVDGACQWSGASAAYGCFWSNGDSFRLQDYAADGHSAAVVWWNYTLNDPNVLYRRGVCIESRGEGYHGGCDMNFHENSGVEIRVCRYDAGAAGTVPDKVYNCNLAVGLRLLTSA